MTLIATTFLFDIAVSRYKEDSGISFFNTFLDNDVNIPDTNSYVVK